MPYQDVFLVFWEQVKESVEEGNLQVNYGKNYR